MHRIVRVSIEHEIDIVTARLRGSELAHSLGFSTVEIYAIAMAISEIARNIVCYACPGEMACTGVEAGNRRGIVIVARDHGPGIRDIAAAMAPGYSTGNSLGLGLSSAQRNMDEFEIVSRPGEGTTVTMAKWHQRK